jgi:hypothetical protein
VPLEQVEALEDETELAVAQVRPCPAAEAADVDAVKVVGTRRRPVQAAQDIQEG